MQANINNPMQLLSFIKKNPNPSQFVYNMVQESMGQNPLFANLLALAKDNNGKEIEKIARNIMAEQGYDFDKEFNNFKQMMGL